MDKVSKGTRSRIMSNIRAKGNKSTEWRLRMLLVRAGISGWQMAPTGVIGDPDFLFPTLSLTLFVDGCFWHYCPRCGHLPLSNKTYWDAKILRTRARDKRIRARLREQGWLVLRIWEHELIKPEQVTARIRKYLAKARRRSARRNIKSKRHHRKG